MPVANRREPPPAQATSRSNDAAPTQPSPLAAQIAAAPQRHDNSNPLWQGPYAEGPLGGVTQSMLVRFMSCRERFRLKYVLGLEPHDKWNKSVGYGNMWHVCEESLARDQDDGTGASVKLLLHANEQITKYSLQRDEITKWYNICRIQFPEYIRYWADHPDVMNRTPLVQEYVFDVPHKLPSGRTVRLRGKFDSVDLIDGDGNAFGGVIPGIYLQENKTKGDIDMVQVERQLKFDLQTMLYLLALSKADHAPPVIVKAWKDKNALRGVRYNVVRRPLSGGVGNIKPHAAKATKTKLTPAETDEEFYERLRRDYIAADPAHWFFRIRAQVSWHDVDAFCATCLDPLLEQLCWWYDEVTGKDRTANSIYGPPMNYRTPFGVWSSLEEGGATEYDAYLTSGSESGLRRVETLFPELQCQQ